MSWTIRTTGADDRQAVLAVVRGAFGAKGRDGEEEVAIVARTWALATGPEHLDLVAVDDGAVVAHALGAVGDLAGTGAVAVAPLCVAPSRQGEGIGSALMTELIARADTAGWPMLLLLGDPRFYQRFGFEPAGPSGSTTARSGGTTRISRCAA